MFLVLQCYVSLSFHWRFQGLIRLHRPHGVLENIYFQTRMSTTNYDINQYNCSLFSMFLVLQCYVSLSFHWRFQGLIRLHRPHGVLENIYFQTRMSTTNYDINQYNCSLFSMFLVLQCYVSLSFHWRFQGLIRLHRPQSVLENIYFQTRMSTPNYDIN